MSRCAVAVSERSLSWAVFWGALSVLALATAALVSLAPWRPL